MNDGPTPDRMRRTNAIVKEIEQYYVDSSDYYRQLDWQNSGLVPNKFKKDIVHPELPSLLVWMEQVDRYGLPNPGTFLDQPADFMEDIESCRLGKQRAEKTTRQRNAEQMSVADIQAKIREVYENVPGGAPLAAR